VWTQVAQDGLNGTLNMTESNMLTNTALRIQHYGHPSDLAGWLLLTHHSHPSWETEGPYLVEDGSQALWAEIRWLLQRRGFLHWAAASLLGSAR
jgi:hypothetical protein